jgi:hypothetical protein
MALQDSQLLAKTGINYDIKDEEDVLQESSPLTLDIDDETLVKIIDKKISNYQKFFTDKYDLFERRKKNEMYLFGRQITEKEKKKELKPYEARYVDNVLYEIEATLKATAMSRLPDMIVTPGNDTEESRQTAENVSKIIDDDLKKRETRQVLGMAFRHLPVYFTGVVKTRWDPVKDDYVFEVVHPDYIEVDETATSKDTDKMNFISQIVPITVEEATIRFPKAKEKLLEQLRKDGILPATPDGEVKKENMMSVIKIREVWFKYWQKKKDSEDEYEQVFGVVWKYKDVILHKTKNPNYDYEGEIKYFKYGEADNPVTKKELQPEDMLQMMVTGADVSNVKKEVVYRNYFDRPRMPFYLLGFDQWGKIPYDETSRIEQNIKNQENLDAQGKSIIDKIKARVKHIFSKEGGLRAEDIEKMDLDDPQQDILVDGDVAKVHSAIIPERPDSADYKNLDDTRSRMYAISGATAIRGQLQTDVATSNQIAREADFTRADDLVEDTINALAEWMAQWSLQFIKLRYTKDHFRKIIGPKGDVTFQKINRDMIEDGMEVRIKASGTDKLKTEKRAMDMAAAKLIDPLNFFRDIGASNPVQRTIDLMTFQTNPAAYMAKIQELGSNTKELVGSLLGGIPPVGNTPQGNPENQLNQLLGTNQTGRPQTNPAEPQAPVGNPSINNTAEIPVPPVGPPQASPRAL